MTSRVLMVCSGNICRSPFAAGLLRLRLREAGVKGIAVSSAGTLRITGRPASPLSIEVARDYGVNLDAHRSRPLGRGTLALHDLALVMDADHRRLIETEWPDEVEKVRRLRSYDTEVPDGRRRDVFDPIGLSEEEYRRCFAIIARCVDNLADTLRRGE